MLYDELNVLVVDGPAWAHIRVFDAILDERGVVLSLKKYDEGDSSKTIRIAAAYHTIFSTRYEGHARDFSLTDCIQNSAQYTQNFTT